MVHSEHQIAAEDKPQIPRRLLQICRNVPQVSLSGSIPRRSISNSRQHQSCGPPTPASNPSPVRLCLLDTIRSALDAQEGVARSLSRKE
jgi:hypothetical protein